MLCNFFGVAVELRCSIVVSYVLLLLSVFLVGAAALLGNKLSLYSTVFVLCFRDSVFPYIYGISTSSISASGFVVC
jgi:hypothetical protein